MKLGMTITQSLKEGLYNVKILSLKLFRPTKVNGVIAYVESDATLTQALLDEMVAKKEGYFDLQFVTTETTPARQDVLRIWPQRFKWTMTQLADKMELPTIEDTAQLINKVVPLYYSHKYTTTKREPDGTLSTITRLNKSWNLYGPSEPEAEAEIADDTPLNI